jgi:hypothetical protein
MGATVYYNHTSELATITNMFAVAGTATDPTTVSLTVTDPDATATTYTYAAAEIARTGIGAYSKDVSCASTSPGVWTAVWVGTGTAVDTAVATWTTHSTALQRLYCTPAELKSRSGITDTLDDAEILAACEATARWIDNYCNRVFWRAASTRTYTADAVDCCYIDDLVSATSVATDDDGDGTYETVWAASGYQLLPVNPAVLGETRPYTQIRAVGTYGFPTGRPALERVDRVQVAGVWGWPAVPDAVKHAATVMSGDLLKLGGMAFGVAGYGDYGPVRARANPIVVSLLDPYRRFDVVAV